MDATSEQTSSVDASSSEPSSKKQQWVRLYKDNINQLFTKRPTEPGITLRMIRVYLLLISKMKFGNFIDSRHKDLASDLGIKPQAFSDALNKLQALRYLVRIQGKKGFRRILLNPSFVFIGSESTMETIQSEFNRYLPEAQKEKSRLQEESSIDIEDPSISDNKSSQGLRSFHRKKMSESQSS